MRKPVGDVAPNADYFANVKFESRLDAAIIPPIQKKRLTQRYRVASWSGEVCPGTYSRRALDRPSRIKARSPQELLNQQRLRFDPGFRMP